MTRPETPVVSEQEEEEEVEVIQVNHFVVKGLPEEDAQVDETEEIEDDNQTSRRVKGVLMLKKVRSMPEFKFKASYKAFSGSTKRYFPPLSNSK